MCCVCFAFSCFSCERDRLLRPSHFRLLRDPSGHFFPKKTSTSVHHINHARQGRRGKKEHKSASSLLYNTFLASFQESGSKGRGLGCRRSTRRSIAPHHATVRCRHCTVHIDCTKRFCYKRLVTFCVLSCSRKLSQTRRHRTREVGRASRWTVSILVCTLELEGTTRARRALRNPLSRQMLITCNMCRIFFDFFQVAAHF